MTASPPMLFLKPAWMEYYSDDPREKITGKHRFLTGKRNMRIAGERGNFANKGAYNYGYAPFHAGSVDLGHLGGSADAEYVDGIDVVFIARRPKIGGVVIVGWYRNARVYRSMRNGNGTKPYLVRARVADCTLVDVIERRTIIPVTAASGPRSPSLWYGTPNSIREARLLLLGRSKVAPATSHARKVDVRRRLEVERRAINTVSTAFSERGYRVTSVESDKCGWDLEATDRFETLRIEVKGSASRSFVPELTPNEFAMFTKHRETYRLCLVTNALSAPMLHEFRFSPAFDRWLERDGIRRLDVEERPGARIHF